MIPEVQFGSLDLRDHEQERKFLNQLKEVTTDGE